MADFDSFLDRESGLAKYFESAQLCQGLVPLE